METAYVGGGGESSIKEKGTDKAREKEKVIMQKRKRQT